MDLEADSALQHQLLSLARKAALGNIISGVSHELNNPLAVILVAAENLNLALGDASPDLAQIRTIAGIICNNTRRMMTLAESLRARAHSPPPGPGNFTKISLKPLVAEILRFTEYFTRKAGLTVCDRIPDGIPPFKGDRILIEQIVITLLSRCASPQAPLEAGTTPTLDILASHAPADADITLEFSCSFGLHELEAEIDLSICRWIAEMHKGSLTWKTNPRNQGTFVLRLPALVPDAQ